MAYHILRRTLTSMRIPLVYGSSVNRGGSIPVTFTPRRATPLACAFSPGSLIFFPFKTVFLWNRSSPSLISRVCAPGTFQQFLESLVSLTHKQSVCTGYLPATPISFILSEVRLPLSIIFMFKRFSFLSPHSPIFTLR